MRTTEKQSPLTTVLQDIAEKIEWCAVTCHIYYLAETLKFIQVEEKSFTGVS
jgi:hypothetical protein